MSNQAFQAMNAAYNRVFQVGKLSIGLVVPIQAYGIHDIPDMMQDTAIIQMAEKLGFSSVWLRDVPFNVPSFGDVGQVYDPFVYLGYLSAHTKQIGLGVASLILPMRHPAHVAKAAASVDALSGGRLLLGIASGDRPEEYPAMNITYEKRGELFRHHFHYIRKMAESRPVFSNTAGDLSQNSRLGMDLLPKPTAKHIPMLITGSSQQAPNWGAEHTDGWMTYPRDINTQAALISQLQTNASNFERGPLPVMQPVYFDLALDINAAPRPIHLGFRSGVNHLIQYLETLEQIGVNHLAINLRFNQHNIADTLEILAEHLFPRFSATP